MNTKSLLILAAGIVAFAMSESSNAQCPEGRTRVIVTTPNAQKVLCIPDEAVPGLENADEHSAGNITPNMCPCFNENDIAGTTCFFDVDGDVESGYCSDIDPSPHTKTFAALDCDPIAGRRCPGIFLIPGGQAFLNDNQCIAADVTDLTQRTGSDVQIEICLDIIFNATSP